MTEHNFVFILRLVVMKMFGLKNDVKSYKKAILDLNISKKKYI